MKKIDFSVTREKFFDRPIYAQAIRELTPTKPEKKEEKEDPKKIQKELLKNNEKGKKDPKTTDNKKDTIKPKVVLTIFQTPARTGSLSKQDKVMNYLSPRSQAKSLFAQSMEQDILPPDLESFGALNDPEDKDRKRTKDQNKSPPGGNSPTEKMHDKKTKSAIPAPVFLQTGTRPKSVSVSK